MPDSLVAFSEHEILGARPPKKRVEFSRPDAFHVESERTGAGHVEDVATIFLTNCECPFRCLMCDLWKNTTDSRTPVGAIPAQIDYALARLPAARHVKLYNSGSFFDARAIPPEDYAAIAQRVRTFETVIVENHPKLCRQDCVSFRDLIQADLEVAIGLETAHPQVLERLNKQMTLEDFQRAVGFLTDNGIAVRAFVLLRPPFLSESEGIDWALRSLKFAFSAGADCCAVIPTRSGNGIMERLEARKLFAPPELASMETVLQAGIEMGRGRVFVDLWDVERFCDCRQCGPSRVERLRKMNLLQESLPPITCDCRS